MSLQVWLPLNGNITNKGLHRGSTITNNGATVNTANAKLGSCYSFNGSGNSIKIVNSPITTSTTEFSIACFFRPASTGTGTIYTGRSAVGGGVSVFLINGSQIRFDDGVQTTFSSFSWSTNTWYHLCVTRTASEKKLYIDGVLKQTVTITNALASDINTTATIGGSSTGGDASGNWLNGQLNDYRIYDHALSLKEVKEIRKGLICNLKLDSIYGPDIYGNRNLTNWTKPNSNVTVDADGETLTYNTASGWELIYCKLNTVKGAKYKVTYDYTVVTAWTKLNNADGYGLFAHTQASASGNVGSALGHHYITSTTAGTTGTGTFEFTSTQADIYLCINGGYIADGLTGVQFKFKNIKVVQVKTQLSDLSGFGNHGTVVGTFTEQNNSPRYESSLIFGSGKEITVGRGAMCSDALTVSLWAYQSDWSALTAPATIISCTESGGWNFEFSSVTNGYYGFPVYVNGGYGTYIGSNTQHKVSSLSPGWHHFCGTENTLSRNFYIDGNLSFTYTSGSTKSTIGYNSGNIIHIGSEAGSGTASGGSYFPGAISDVRIYGTALSASEVGDLYKGTTKIDKSGNLFTGQIVEDTSFTITKSGITKASGFAALGKMSDLCIIKYGDATWLKVLRHTNPKGQLFSSTTGGTNISNKGLYSRISDISKFKSKDNKFEFLMRQAGTSGGTVVEGRWTQTSDPLTTTSITGFTKISGTIDRGIVKCSGNTYLAATSSTGDWWAACGCWTAYNGGIPGFNKVTVTTGFMELYVRIDNTGYDLSTLTTTSSTDAGRIYEGNMGAQFSNIYEI